MQCIFGKAWIGKCTMEADESGYCEEHENVKCCSCGEKATHECDETGSLVCGAPLCDECTHNTHPEGHNGMMHRWPEGMKAHCKKSEQKYAPWYVNEETLPLWKSENGISQGAEIKLTGIANPAMNPTPATQSDVLRESE